LANENASEMSHDIHMNKIVAGVNCKRMKGLELKKKKKWLEGGACGAWLRVDPV